VPNQRRFITDKELEYIEATNKELIQDAASQLVYYYAIVVKSAGNEDDDVYGESVVKTVTPPVEIYARVLFPDPEQRIGEHGADILHQIELYFHKTECDEKGVKVRAGDFVEYARRARCRGWPGS